MKIATFSLVTALALGGLLAGARVASAQQTKAEIKDEERNFTPQQRVEAMDKTLKLSADQKAKILPFFELQEKRMRQAERTASAEKREKEYEAMHKAKFDKMREVLTADQYQKWFKIEEHRRQAAAAAEKKAEGK